MHGELFRHQQPKGLVSATAQPKHHRATPRLYKGFRSTALGRANIGLKMQMDRTARLGKAVFLTLINEPIVA